MRRMLLIAACLLVGCFAGVAMREIIVPARAQGFAGIFYEHSAIKIANPNDEEVNAVLARFGREGWRLSSTTIEWNHWLWLFFERPLPRIPYHQQPAPVSISSPTPNALPPLTTQPAPK